MRVALGARRLDVLGLIMSEAGKLVLFGVVAGLGLSLLAGRSVASLLFGITAKRPAASGIGLRASSVSSRPSRAFFRHGAPRASIPRSC